MANRSFHRAAGALEIETVSLWGSLTVGAVGAVAASSGKGIASIVRLSAGRYQINLQDTYNTLLYADVVRVLNGVTDPTANGMILSVALNSVNAGVNPSLTIQFAKGSDGTAADPLTGSQFLIKLDLKNSSVP